MTALFLRLSAMLHHLTLGFCLLLLLILFSAQLAVVLLRYGLGIGFLELQDLVTYSFAGLVPLSLPVALRLDRHVRVDILRSRLQAGTNRHMDIAGHLLLLAPVFGLLIWYVHPLVAYAWSILEGSRETGGLPGLFLVKTSVEVAAALMLVQALALILAPRESKP